MVVLCKIDYKKAFHLQTGKHTNRKALQKKTQYSHVFNGQGEFCCDSISLTSSNEFITKENILTLSG